MMQKIERGTKIFLGVLIAAAALTGIYEMILHTVPEGLAIRVWYQKISFAVIMIWQISLIAVTIWISTKVFGVVEAKAARYIGRAGIWICCVIILFFLALVWIIKLLNLDLEYENDNGTVTIGHTDFFQETEYSLWEKEGFLYRRYLRESANRDDIDPNQTMAQFLKERYPQIYDKQTESSGGYPLVSGEKADIHVTESYISNEEADNDMGGQYAADKRNDGLVAIYEVISESEREYHFETSWGAHGDPQAIIYEDAHVVRFIRYDRVSKNEACYLYVYYEAVKNEDGSYSPTEARILDMYAYVVDTGQVVLSGKKTWSDLGDEEYREATGE